MTMSISSAPAATACCVSETFTSMYVCPLGNPVATDAMWMPVPATACFTNGTMAG